MIELSESERGMLLLGLRTVRANLSRKSHHTERKLAEWTDAKEASNPGYRQAMYDRLGKHADMLDLIDGLKRKVNHA